MLFCLVFSQHTLHVLSHGQNCSKLYELEEVHPSSKQLTPTFQKIVMMYWFVRTRILWPYSEEENVLTLQMYSVYLVYGPPRIMTILYTCILEVRSSSQDISGVLVWI